MKVPFVITPDSITMFVEGRSVHIPASFPGYAGAAAALTNGRHDEAVRCGTLAGAVAAWDSNFGVLADQQTVTYNGVPLPAKLSERILTMVVAGESTRPLRRFWERLDRNPSKRSVAQLYDFLANKGIPISEDGFVLAYKAVRRDYLDYYSQTFDNHPGMKHRMDRALVCEDPNQHCAPGFHVGDLTYARTYGSADRRQMICKVDPADVVSVPNDCECRKMRVCAYEVVGHHSGQEMASTTTKDDQEVRDSVTMSRNINQVDNSALAEQVAARNHDKTPKLAPGDLLGHNAEDGLLPGAPIYKRGDVPECADCSGCPDCMTNDEPKSISVPRRFERYASMPVADLLELPLEFLRQLAGQVFKIVGASKVRGGKIELVRLIEEVRGG